MAQTETQTDIERIAALETTVGHVATKADVANVRTEIVEVRTEIAEVRTEIAGVHTKIAELHTLLAGQIGELRTEMRAEIAGMRSEMKLMRWSIGIGISLMSLVFFLITRIPL